MASIGQVIAGKYEILTLIGRGGMSKVYLAMDKNLNKQWAIKEIEKRARDANNEIVIQSAIAEANMIKQLDHAAIVRIVDIIDQEDVIYIVEDYIEGETLSSILDHEGVQPQEVVIDWGIQICEALEYLHTRTPPIVYRDMKPANVMLKPEGTIKVIDFGIAREYKAQSLEDTTSLGTRGYAAPEQFGGRGQTDARTDIYCLGVTLYHLVTGRNPSEPPYEIQPIRSINPQLSAGLEAIIMRCTQQNPEDRYQSCAELLYALRHYEEYGAAYRARQKRRLGSFIAAVATALVCLGVGLFGMFMRTQTNNADYDQNILWAEKATSVTEKVDFYSTAIDIKPLEAQAYLGMIDAFKEDAAFSTDEESALKRKLDANSTELREQPGYAELAYEVGKLYWYYYDYGRSEGSDNQVTRTINASQWFADTVDYGTEGSEYYTMATIYRDIGEFNKEITVSIAEASDRGKYLPYWENISSLVSMIAQDADRSEIVELEVYKLAINSIETYARKFKSDGVTREDMEAVLLQAMQAVENVSTTSDTTEQLKAETMTRFAGAEAAVANAYRE